MISSDRIVLAYSACVPLHSHARFTGILYSFANRIRQNGNQGRPRQAR